MYTWFFNFTDEDTIPIPPIPRSWTPSTAINCAKCIPILSQNPMWDFFHENTFFIISHQRRDVENQSHCSLLEARRTHTWGHPWWTSFMNIALILTPSRELSHEIIVRSLLKPTILWIRDTVSVNWYYYLTEKYYPVQKMTSSDKHAQQLSQIWIWSI